MFDFGNLPKVNHFNQEFRIQATRSPKSGLDPHTNTGILSGYEQILFLISGSDLQNDQDSCLQNETQLT